MTKNILAAARAWRGAPVLFELYEEEVLAPGAFFTVLLDPVLVQNGSSRGARDGFQPAIPVVHLNSGAGVGIDIGDALTIVDGHVSMCGNPQEGIGFARDPTEDIVLELGLHHGRAVGADASGLEDPTGGVQDVGCGDAGPPPRSVVVATCRFRKSYGSFSSRVMSIQMPSCGWPDSPPGGCFM